MRKMVICACLAGALAAADVLCTAVYVYKNPDSFLGRCAATGFLFSTQYNPFLFGYKVVSSNVSTLLSSKGEAVAQKETEEYECPDEPTAVEEEDAVAGEPLPGLHAFIQIPTPPPVAAVADDIDDLGCVGGAVVTTVEPPLADLPECGSAQEVDPALSAATGGAGCMVNPASPRFMPYCTPDEDECADHGCLTGWFWQTIEDCVAASKMVTDTHVLGFWFSYFSAPSTLENKGDAELSEPEEPPMPACEPSCTPPVQQQKSKKVRMPGLGDGEDSETPIVHPEIDTMEFRPSDRTWDDYGPPFHL